MSTAPAPIAGAAAAPVGAAAAPAKPDTAASVPADIRRRVLGARPPSPADATQKQLDDKAKADKEAADKLASEKKTADEKKKADDAAAAAAAGNPPPSQPRVKKTKEGPALPEKPPGETEAQMRERIQKDEADKAAAAHRKPAPIPSTNPEVEREIELAKFAETKHPDRYAGFTDKVTTFFTARDEMLAAKAKELGGANSAEFKDYLDGDEFKGWIDQHRPSYARGDKVKLSEDMIADRGRAEATREMQPKLKQLERQTAELQHAPEINAKTNAALHIIITDPNEVKDPAMEGFAKDPVKFGEEHPEEAQVIAAEAGDAVELIREVYRIDRDLVDFNPKARPQQQRIRDFMVGQNASMRAKHPNGLEMPDGKILIDAATFTERGLEKDPRYRVFSADEIAGMIAATRQSEILAKLGRRRVGVQKSIYAPKVETPPAAPAGQSAAAAEEPPSPAAGASSAPGARAKPTDKEPYWKRYV